MTHQDSEFTTQVVNVDRLYHRQLLARLNDIEALEKKWNCKIVFPSTELASDEVNVTGPQWQVPQCVDEFLVCRVRAFSCQLFFFHPADRFSPRAWCRTTTS